MIFFPSLLFLVSDDSYVLFFNNKYTIRYEKRYEKTVRKFTIYNKQLYIYIIFEISMFRYVKKISIFLFYLLTINKYILIKLCIRSFRS